MKYIITILLILFSLISFAQTRFFSESELHLKTDAELLLLRNEVYARKGYIFANKDYQEYFSQFDWYKPLDDNKSIALSGSELEYINLIKKIEKIRVKRPEMIKAYFVDFKNKLLTLGNSFLKSQEIDWEDTRVSMAKIFNHLDLDAAQFNGDSGGYRIIVDNGKEMFSYYILYKENSIIVGYGYNDNSELKEDSVWHTMWRDSIATGEFCQWLRFSINSGNEIQYEEINGAG